MDSQGAFNGQPGTTSDGRHTESASALQSRLLQGVSRTFALTIPELPAALREVVSNAYLLCRIIDTVEDEPALSLEHKRQFAEQFVDIVAGTKEAEPFSTALAPLLSGATLETEHELIRLTPDVIRITHGFNPRQREALATCVRIMAEGMVQFQQTQSSTGLKNIMEMERYCYYVAGVVGEMLTKLFCDYSPEIARHEERLMGLSVYFGQGLQMTNILKDTWDDLERGACWLPRDVFRMHDFDLDELKARHDAEGFRQGLGDLIALAFARLNQALEYTLLIPREETGIRNFCLWAIGMAELTLRKINQHRDFTDGTQVKISRRSVKMTVLGSRLAARHDSALRLLFRLAGRGLPRNMGSLRPLVSGS